MPCVCDNNNTARARQWKTLYRREDHSWTNNTLVHVELPRSLFCQTIMSLTRHSTGSSEKPPPSHGGKCERGTPASLLLCPLSVSFSLCAAHLVLNSFFFV